MRVTRARELAIGAIFAALVCAATLVLALGIPATGGYFNVGEIVIYVAALLFGPIVGAFAGGVGAAIADMVLAAQFAPGTLIVKSFEGAIVGFLNRSLKRTSRPEWGRFIALLGIGIGVFLATTGFLFYSHAQVFADIAQDDRQRAILWSVAGTITALLVIFAGFKIQPESGRAVFSIMVGGLEMVVGYFLYEELALGETTAIVEIPANVGQMMIGLIVAIPIARIVLRNLPQLKT
jgi:uncharacterized membrane protein